MLLRSNAGLRQSVVKTNIYLVSLCKISSLICSKHNERTISLSFSFQGDQAWIHKYSKWMRERGLMEITFTFEKNPLRLIHVKMYAHALPFPCFNFFLLVLFALLYYTLIFRNLQKIRGRSHPQPLCIHQCLMFYIFHRNGNLKIFTSFSSQRFRALV